MDPRLIPANGRAALESLRGAVGAPRFTQGEPATMIAPLTDLCTAPSGPRDRQLLMGDAVTVIDRHQGWAFVQSGKDGHCGYVPEPALGTAEAATHWVAAPATHLYPEPKLKIRETAALTMGARLAVLGEEGNYSRTTRGYVPTLHLRTLGNWHADPVAVAQTFLGVPYLWGGNSRAGLDCSGLVQAALHATGKDCPSDSDLQQDIGKAIVDKSPLKRGDLIFWKGHVAMAMNADFMIHATAAFMAVVVENTKTAIARITKAGGGPVTQRRRP